MLPEICSLQLSNRVLSNSLVFANQIGGKMVLICMFLMNEAEQLFTYFRAISVFFFPCELPVYLLCPFS